MLDNNFSDLLRILRTEMCPSKYIEAKHVGKEIMNLFYVPQDPKHHPEGSAGIHTFEVIDRARKLLPHVPEWDRSIFMLAALLHDIGKYSHTFYREGRSKRLVHWSKNKPKGARIVSYGHDLAGKPLAKKWLEQRTSDKEIIQRVPKLVSWHMKPLLMKEAKLKAFKKLANTGCEMYLIGILSWADKGEIPNRWFDMLGKLTDEN